MNGERTSARILAQTVGTYHELLRGGSEIYKTKGVVNEVHS